MKFLSPSPILRLWIGIASVAILFAALFFFLFKQGTKIPTQSYIDRKLQRESEALNKLNFNLVDPGEAPETIRSLARFGYAIMINTQKYAPDYVGGRLNCTNCHFAGGNTTGGAQGSISLAGVATKYPQFDSGLQLVADLPARINSCFTRSMNGKPLPRDSQEMLALVTYLQWISKGLAIYKPVPWLGLQQLSIPYHGDAAKGQRIYHVYCALCHHDDGQGGETNPPLWGEGSFNDLAGMNRLPILASFIYWNMPYMDQTPVLSPEEAIDVASYILSKPRPKFTPSQQSFK
jgi:thiosulfate dehydrogenase